MKMVFFDVANTLLYKPDLFPNIQRTLEDHGIKIKLRDIAQTHKMLSEVIKFPDKTSSEFYQHFNTELLYALGVIPSESLVDAIFNNCKYLPWKAFEDTRFISGIHPRMGGNFKLG